MKFTASLLARFGFSGTALAQGVQTAHLTFHGGPASYELAVPADGNVYPTNNIIAISIIDAPDYNAFGQCTFYTNGEKTLVSQITESGLQQVVVGPPQPITGVSCSGVCIPTYGECFGIDGQSKGSCCSGFCAGTRCRPWAQ